MSSFTDDLAERAAPGLAALVHPGDSDVPPFPLSLPIFQPATLPEGMAQEEADALKLPSADFGKLFLQAEFHMLREQFNIELIDAAELADLRAAAAEHEHKRIETKRFQFACGQPAFRVTIRDFDSDHPIIPCETDNVQAAHTHG